MFSDSSLSKALGLVAFASLASAGPCDIYAQYDTPCVAAHSTTRALYNSYNGPLYEVVRGSDGSSTNIAPLSAGGVANAGAQDSFCANTTCVIQTIYDQSGNGNNLTPAPPGGETAGPQSNGYDNPASAIGAPVTLNGQKAYGIFSSPGTGYRIEDTKGVATGNEPESIYAVLDGTHFNDNCCFDYGNAETNAHDDGDATMEAIYFGTCTVWDKGAGSGPWIMADLENGLYSSNAEYGTNSADPTQNDRFLTAMVKGGTDGFALLGGNAQSGDLSTYYNGSRPSGYQPMNKQGAIILGIGGDNSDGAQGTFYEGVMTSGLAPAAADAAVQANVVAAGYATTSLVSGPAVNPGSTVTMRVTTPGFTTRYIAQNGTSGQYSSSVVTTVITSSSPSSLQQLGLWKVVEGLAQSDCVSFESSITSGSYIRHYAFELYVDANDGSAQFADDATFCPKAALNGQGNSIMSWSYPTRFFRNYADTMFVASEGGPQYFDTTNSYNNDVSYVVGSGFES